MHTRLSKKRSLLALVAVFVMPVVLAKLALEQQWFEQGATNKGTLLQPVVSMTPVLGNESKHWRLVYTLPSVCDAACDNALISIQQVWLALGREAERAKPVVLVTSHSDSSALAQLVENASFSIVSVDEATLSNVLFSLPINNIYVVDTQDNAMLRYPLYQDQQEAILHSRAMLADLKKLLKLSRIG